MINLFSKSAFRDIVLPLFFVWLFVCCTMAYRLNLYGAFASVSMTKTLQYLKDCEHANPDGVRLNQSYAQWAIDLNLTDTANYIKTGIGFADGKGINHRNISPADPNNKTYMPYYFQSPGTPIVIGMMMKLFGRDNVTPYFILIAISHFITTLFACKLASYYFEENTYVLGVGLLSLLCLPVLDFNLGMGLFSSEPLSNPFIGLSLIAIADFWKKLEENTLSYKHLFLLALSAGIALASASYFRGIYTTFAKFCSICLFAVGLLKTQKRQKLFLFALVVMTTVAVLQYPWEARNKRYFGEFTMDGSTYYGYSMWHDIWENQHDTANWGWNAAHGLGNYLAPEKSEDVLARLDQNKKEGSQYAMQSLLHAVIQKPLEAIQYKLSVYDTLWLGQRCNWYIYLWCFISIFSFFAFLTLTRFRFIPSLWLFPVFLFCLSPIIHYEHRYSQPFYFFVTPIAVMYVLRYFLIKRRQMV